MFTRIFLGLLLVLSLTGCATTQNKTQADQWQGRVVELEKKLEEKDSEIVDLQYQVKDLSSKVETKANYAEEKVDNVAVAASAAGGDALIRANTTPEKVQKALKAAGYYSGKVDGKIGSGTKAAIIAFQKSAGLNADGVVGKKTWDSLKKQLD